MADNDEWAGQDRPIADKKFDHLDRGPFVESLVRALVRDTKDENGYLVARRSTGYVVGLTGRWGLGKSSVLLLLEQRMRTMPYVLVTTFNPWLFKGRDELLVGFFEALRHALGRSASEQAREISLQLNRYWKAVEIAGHAVAAYVDAHGGAGAATSWWSRAKKAKPKIPEQRSLQTERRLLERKLVGSKLAIVVLIDELDRVEDEEVRAVAQLIKAIGDIRGISYLVAYDPDRVADALGRGEGPARRESGERYIEKIIQYPIPLRPLLEEDIDALLRGAFQTFGIELSIETATGHQKSIIDALRREIQSPRDVKRLVGAFGIVEATIRGEVCPFDTLGYCWILTKSPILRDAIAAKVEKLVDDPSPNEMAERLNERLSSSPTKPDPTDILGDSAAGFENVLRLLFARFGGAQRNPDDQGTRISQRRNLIRLLYLGNPPSMISKAELQRLWMIRNPADLDHELQQLAERGTIRSVLDRLDDLLADLDESGDLPFWLAFSRLLVRQSDWINGPEPLRNYADDAVTVLMNFVMRNRNRVPRLKKIIEALIQSGDLVIVPGVLRKHLFRHGMTKHRSSKSDRFGLSEVETRDLLDREAPRYRNAVVTGEALRRLPDMEAIYVLGNMKRWDQALREALTQQLENPQALATLAALVVPPGYSTERAHLDELFDATAASNILDRLGPIPNWITDPWLRSAVVRFRAVLDGLDPNFIDDDEQEQP